MIKISACLVVYNEEKIIKRCLDSIKDVVNEIIVVHDGGCEDKTLEICGKYTDKIYIAEYAGIAEPHRPLSYRRAGGDWILQIDADEYLSEDLRKRLRNLTEDNKADAYEFLWPIWNGEWYITKTWPVKRALFRKSRLAFLGIPQFVPQIKGKVMPISLTLEHKPNYNNYSFGVFKNKWLKWARIQALYYLKDFHKIEKFNYILNDWPRQIKFRLKHPMILIPFEFIITFFKVLYAGGYRQGVIGFKVAILTALYRVSVNYYVYKNK